jgi:hypothetical protein
VKSTPLNASYRIIVEKGIPVVPRARECRSLYEHLLEIQEKWLYKGRMSFRHDVPGEKEYDSLSENCPNN